MALYEKMELFLRNIEYEVVDRLSISKDAVDRILDPICEVDQPVFRDKDDSAVCCSKFVPKNYISSSIMDCFHYFEPNRQKSVRFVNNHGSHTDR